MEEQSEALKGQYLVEFDIPQPLPDYLVDMIPQQREAMDELFADARLLSYAVTLDRTKVFAVFLAYDMDELIESINRLPMTIYMEYHIRELMFHNTVHMVPSMSLN